MYITNVASHLGAWIKLQNDYPNEYREVKSVISSLEPSEGLGFSDMVPSRDNEYIPDLIRDSIKTKFEDAGWRTRERITVPGNKSRTSIIDVVKNSIGIEYTFGKFHYSESVIFVKFPLFINANKFKVGFVIMPTKSMLKFMPSGIGSFEMVRDRIKDITPLPLKYPFGIIGVSDQQSDLIVEEFTSSLDQYLLELLGFTLVEMILSTEKQNYDFKETLSAENNRVAKEICAFANLSGGGMILLGVEDNGNATGIPRESLDDTQLRIRNIAATNCYPLPEIDCRVFDLPDYPERCLLTIYINEVPRKPCMANEKVYIRAGTAARPANADELRRLILGTNA